MSVLTMCKFNILKVGLYSLLRHLSSQPFKQPYRVYQQSKDLLCLNSEQMGENIRTLNYKIE